MQRGLYFSFQGLIAIILVLLAFAVIPFSQVGQQATHTPAFYESQDRAVIAFYLSDETAVTSAPLIAAENKDNQFCSPFLVWTGYDLNVSQTAAVCNDE